MLFRLSFMVLCFVHFYCILSEASSLRQLTHNHKSEAEYTDEKESLEEPRTEAMSPDSDPFTCTPERDFVRVGGTYNDPSKLIVETPLECCRICSEEERCETWSRDRITGGCALKEIIAPLYPDERFDSGSFDTARANEMTTVGPCDAGTRTRYNRGIELERSNTQSANECCERCRNNVDCFSWFRHQGNGRCVLNRNVPQATRDSNYRGNSLI